MSSFGAGGGSATGTAGLDKNRQLLEGLKLGGLVHQMGQQIQQGPNQAAVQPGQMLGMNPQQRLAMVMRQYGGGQ